MHIRLIAPKNLPLFIIILVLALAASAITSMRNGNYNVNLSSLSPDNSGSSTEHGNKLVVAWVKPSNGTGSEKNVYLPSEDVYVVIKTTGKGSKTVRIYIVENEGWKNGEPMDDVSGVSETVTLTGDGPTIHEPVLIWAAPLNIGEYDIVVDENMNGKRDPGEKVADSNVTPGLFVVPEFPIGTLTAIVAPLLAVACLMKRHK